MSTPSQDDHNQFVSELHRIVSTGDDTVEMLRSNLNSEAAPDDPAIQLTQSAVAGLAVILEQHTKLVRLLFEENQNIMDRVGSALRKLEEK